MDQACNRRTRVIAALVISTATFISALSFTPSVAAQQASSDCVGKLDEAKAKAAEDNAALENANQGVVQAEAARIKNPGAEASQAILAAQEKQKLSKLSADSSAKMLERAQRKCPDVGGAKNEHKPAVKPATAAEVLAPAPVVAKPVAPTPPPAPEVAAPAPVVAKPVPPPPVPEVAAPAPVVAKPVPPPPVPEVVAPTPVVAKPVAPLPAPEVVAPAPVAKPAPVAEVAPPPAPVVAKPAPAPKVVAAPAVKKESEEPAEANCIATPERPTNPTTEPTPLDQQLMAYAQGEMRRIDKLLASPASGDKPTYSEAPVLEGSKLKPCTKAAKETLTFKYLGAGQYRAEAHVLAGEQEFKVGTHATLKRVVPEEENGELFVFILDASKDPEQPRLVAFKKWYLNK